MRSRVAVLFGGTSRERRVSVASAQHLAEVLGDDADVVWWFWSASGEVVECPASELIGHTKPFEADFEPTAVRRWANIDAVLDDAVPDDAVVTPGTVVVLALHGGDGENGEVQRRLEQRSLAFTGSGSDASALAFDKERSREAMAHAGVAVADAVVVDPLDPFTWEAARALQIACGRIVLKPVADGSSFGLRFITDTDDLMPALQELAESPDPALHLAEQYLVGRELTVGLLEDGDGELVCLPPSEVILDGVAAFDFDAKYLGRGAVEITPADVDPDLRERLWSVARTAHRTLGCRGYSRTDLIVDADGTAYYLETNTLPGLTRASFIPQQLAAAGISMADFLARQLALVRRSGA